MKKFLVLISLILCVSMLFTACNKKTDDVVEDQGPVDSVEANIAMLVKTLNACENVDSLVNTATTTVDYEDIVAALKKVSAQGSASINVVEDGEDEGSVSMDFAMKDNTLNATVENVDGESVGIYGSISEAYELAMATWEKDGDFEDIDAFAFDIKSVMDEVMAMAEESMGDDTTLPFDISEIKLPTFTADAIKYEDGKYILGKSFLYDAIMVTVDSVIDAAENEGNVLPEGFDEQYDAIKEMADGVVEAIDLEIYFLIKCEVIEGIGMSCNVNMDDVAEACGEENHSGMEYIKGSVELSAKGELLDIEYKEDGNVNKISAKIDWIYNGEAICGFDAKYDIDMTTGYESSYNEEYYSSESKSTTIMKQSVTAKLDLSAFDKADATVFESRISVNEEYSREYKYSNQYGENRNEKSHRIGETTIEVSLKTTEANKANLVINGVNKYDNTSNYGEGEEKDKGESTIEITGTISFTTKDVTVPAPNSDVKDAIADAEVITSVSDMGAEESYPEESYPDYE